MRRGLLALFGFLLGVLLFLHFFSEPFLISLSEKYFLFKLKNELNANSSSRSKAFTFIYDEKGKLLFWNTNFYIPPDPLVKRLIQEKGNFDTVVTSPYHVLYCYWQPTQQDSNVLKILPLQVTYKHKTILFQNSIYNPFPISSLEIHYSKKENHVEKGFWLVNQRGHKQVYISFPDIHQLTLPLEQWLWFLLLFDVILLILSFPSYIDFILALSILRIALLFSHHFSVTLKLALFTAQVLAVHTFIPSLGDLFLNAFCLIILFFKLPRVSLSFNRAYKWILLGITFIFCLLYLEFILQIFLNSKIELTFSSLKSLSFHHFLLIIGILSPFLLISYLLSYFGNSFLFFSSLLGRTLFFLFIFITIVFYLFWDPSGWGGSILSSIALTLLLFTYPFSEIKKLRSGFLFFVVVVCVYLFLPLQAANQQKQTYTYKKFVQFLNNPRDLVTEYYLEEIANELKQDTVYQDSISFKGMLNYFFEKYFQNKIKGYQVRVYLYDRFYRMVAGNEPNSPLTPPYRLKSPIFPFTYVYSVFYPRHVVGYYYAVKISFVHPVLGKFYLHAECIPVSIQVGKEVDLFLQESPLKIPPQVSLAIYQDGFRIFQYGKTNFPLRFDRESLVSYQIFQIGEDRFAVVRPQPISFVASFIHYTLLFFLVFLSMLVLLFFQNIQSYFRFIQIYFYTFRFRLHFLLFLVVFLMLVLYLVLSPYLLREYYYTALEKEILKKLEFIQKSLAQELPRLSVLRNQQAYQYYIDLDDFTAVYDTRGRLINARFPMFFRSPYFSELIDPEVFERSRYEQRWVKPVVFGKMSFFSGYAVIFRKNFPIGYLWLLYPMENPELEKELHSTIALLFSIVFLFVLVLFVISISLSEQLIRPIRLLKFQLIRTVYGHERQPIEWRGKDEMASLIQAYNRMLQLLEESEKQLKLKEREMAWQRMARQVAHEIKNPLTPMKLSLQHLMRQLNDVKHQQLVGTVLRQIENLHQIANAFSDFAKRLESGQLFQREQISLVEVLEEIVSLFSHQSNVEVVYEKEVLSQTPVLGNRSDLQRAFINLVQNAIQAIEKEGMVKITLLEKEDSYWISIRDTGGGIPEEIRPHIFEPNFTTKSSGMGLGLAITKQIIEQHKGTISYETEVGKGTTFYISLPKVKNDSVED